LPKLYGVPDDFSFDKYYDDHNLIHHLNNRFLGDEVAKISQFVASLIMKYYNKCNHKIDNNNRPVDNRGTVLINK
jgi:hypothetical protein